MADRITTPVAREVEPESPPDESSPAPVQKTASAGGFLTWLPLLATALTMPALAYATTQFILLPKIKQAMIQAAAPGADEASASKDKDAAAIVPGKDKVLVPLPKILVNVAGSMMTRYLTMSVTLVGNTTDFKDRILKNQPQLQDLANGTLMTKTIADLEKPDSRNIIRSELLTVFNNALGGPVIQEIYITEQAIQ
ncbi:MAG TPA: flagellar basal body-associated FliL family protein [Candidatus Acidoferrum sp.]|nr:flagellar basal body-associated FliL family protein [Candidatus Acidoferrum sp.]